MPHVGEDDFEEGVYTRLRFGPLEFELYGTSLFGWALVGYS